MIEIDNPSKVTICVIGLGYVGLPLAIAFAEAGFVVHGYDTNKARVHDLCIGTDKTNEVTSTQLKDLDIHFTSFESSVPCDADFYIIAVPTGVTSDNLPDFTPLISASEMVGRCLGVRSCEDQPIVIYESTVYPGATEEICITAIEDTSGWFRDSDFGFGYSPERLKPNEMGKGMKDRIKLTSGSNEYVAELVDQLYKTIITAGTYKCPSIQVAESSKLIENTQRDINIAFMNELSRFFNATGIDTAEVLQAARTKDDFIDLKPGLVGGHCISIDPFYLINRASQYGVKMNMTKLARQINNDEIVEDIFNAYIGLKSVREIDEAKTLILGFAFKENCADYRDTRVAQIAEMIQSCGDHVDIFDPVIDRERVEADYPQLNFIWGEGIKSDDAYDAVILAVPHELFVDYGTDSHIVDSENRIFIDIKGVLPKEMSDFRL